MMMISSSKLRKSQGILLNLYPYEQKLSQLLNIFLSEEKEIISPVTEQRKIKRVAIVVFSSNSSLAGRFNDEIEEDLKITVNTYRSLGKENIVIYPIGEKVTKVARELGFEPKENYIAISEKPTYEEAKKIADELMDMFLNQEIDRVELIYHHFRSKSSQKLVHETLLPIELTLKKPEEKSLNYIVEPDKQTIMDLLIPKVIRLKLYTSHVDSVTSEHAARMLAMQVATDNADNLLNELTLQYNKLRQQTITNELLDIIGGSFGNAQ